ncbi:MAG: radical SAM protein [Thermoplasmatales archaeon]|nr:radical SAM protein [Thermoplasmatales archaeon]
MKKVFINTQSCIRREIDAEKIANYFIENNYEIVNKPNDADVIVFVACAALNSITKKALKKVLKFKKYQGELIVAGCLPEVDRKDLCQIFNGKTLVTKNIGKIDTYFPKNDVKFENLDDANFAFVNNDYTNPLLCLNDCFKKLRVLNSFYQKIKSYTLRHIFGKKSLIYSKLMPDTYYYINISRGCTRNCTYCRWKKAVGELKSKSIEKCLEEFKNGLKCNYRYFMLNTDDTGAYGLDIGTDFPSLLNQLTEIHGSYEIEIRNLSPKWLTEYIDQLEMIIKKKKIRRISLPIQSGNNRVLEMMNRYSDSDNVKDCILRLKKAYPGLIIDTHIIAGFPTEKNNDFEKTMYLVKKIRFDGGFIFPFSCKNGSAAEKIEPKVPVGEIYNRMKYSNIFLKKQGYKTLYSPRFLGYLFFWKKMVDQ